MYKNILSSRRHVIKSKILKNKVSYVNYNIFAFFEVYSYTLSDLTLAYPTKAADYLPLVNALLTKAVSTGQDKISSTIHTNTALFLVSQLLYPAMWKMSWSSDILCCHCAVNFVSIDLKSVIKDVCALNIKHNMTHAVSE